LTTLLNNKAATDQDLVRSLPIGLTEAEAHRRRKQGQGNDVAFSPSRSYGQIVRDNALMSINVIIFAIGIALILLGLFNDAIVTVGVVLLNVIIAVVQEIRTKRALDRIALLSRLKVTIIREQTERAVDPAEIVVGDLLVANPGDQVMVDGVVFSRGAVDLDESLLTGEPDAVSRTQGEKVYSGSFVVNGRMVYEAQRVGMGSMANQLAARARAFRPAKTPLQREVELILRVMVVLALVLGGPLLFDLGLRLLSTAATSINGPHTASLERAYQGSTVQESVRSAAVVVSVIPQGLALMLTVSYAMAAMRLIGKGTLLQQVNAIESMSHVDILCFDKTGTLTTNQLTCDAVLEINLSEHDLVQALGDFAANVTSPNRTIEAIAKAYPGRSRQVREEIGFTSARKWSALSFADDEDTTYLLGAPDVLFPSLQAEPHLNDVLDRWSTEGLRVLALAKTTALEALSQDEQEWRLPEQLRLCGLVSFRDELQPGASMVWARFEEAGIALKIISGDHPDTVAALARQAGFGRGRVLQTVSGLALEGMSEAERAQTAETASIFGRITPDQKLDLIRYLQRQGHYVAMVGDGVNDVLALKQAELGIAMEHGSQASRAVSDVVLLGDAFNILPATLQEGQRIVRAARELLQLFLARSLSMVVVIVGAGVLGVVFPLIPTHNALPALLTIGLPTIAVAAWARPGQSSGSLLRSVLLFSIPAAISLGAVELMLFLSYLRVTDDVVLARTVLTTAAVLCGLLLILFVEPPVRAASDRASNIDWKPIGLVISMLALFGLIMSIQALRDFFVLSVLSPIDITIVVLAAATWAVGLRAAWRAELLQRWLGLASSS
jgi:cation-transporting P-type ATPase E